MNDKYELDAYEQRVAETVASVFRIANISWESRRVVLATLCSADHVLGEHAEELMPGSEDFERLSGRISHNIGFMGPAR